MTKVIKSAEEYTTALDAFDRLVAISPEPGTPEGDELELQILLIDEYESRTFPFEQPDPVDAILFRMEQKGLTQRDLIPLLGSRSKVSEVLNRERPLTLQQIRALHSGLGLPASVLIQESQLVEEDSSIEWDRFPIRELVSRHWIMFSSKEESSAAAVKNWFNGIPGSNSILSAMRLRTSTVRGKQMMDRYALSAWAARVVEKAQAERLPAYSRGNLTKEFLTSLVKLSANVNGVVLAIDRLRDVGVCVKVVDHLPKTRLDGAAIVIPDISSPIVGLTLRFDRLDYFWFTLLHELAHIVLHLDHQEGVFFDDLEYQTLLDQQEAEADEFARNSLIPPEVWLRSPARILASPYAAETLAEQLGISPAIVAGRMRYEHRAYRLMNNLVGHGEVRKQLIQED